MSELSVQATIDDLAQAVYCRGFSMPAIFMLEMYKPLVGIFHASAMVTAPLLVPIFGIDRYQAALKLLSGTEQVEEMIRKIELLYHPVKGS